MTTSFLGPKLISNFWFLGQSPEFLSGRFAYSEKLDDGNNFSKLVNSLELHAIPMNAPPAMHFDS